MASERLKTTLGKYLLHFAAVFLDAYQGKEHECNDEYCPH